MRTTAKTMLTTACGALALTAGSAPAQVNVGAQVRIDSGRGTMPCNETTMAASPANPLEIVAGWNDYRDSGFVRNGIGLSLDGGETWTDFLLRPPAPFQASVEGDPMTAADPRTGAIWGGGISFAGNGGIFCARKDPGATTFQPSVMINAAGGIDKGWMAAGPDPADPSGATRVYCAYNFGSQFSTDLGDTWSGVTSLGSGLGFLPRVGPNGEYYVTYWDFGTGVRLARSFDGGLSFVHNLIATRMDVWGIDGSRVPGNYRVASLNGLAVDSNDGALYCVYPDTTSVVSNGSNLDVYFCKSTDLGATWTTPVVINQDASPVPGDQFFPWIEVDESGRLHLVFLDTRHIVQNDTDSPGFIDAYYSYSDDQGASWTEIRLTAAPWSSGLDGFGDGFIGDYLGMSTAGNRTLPLYLTTDNGDADIFTNVITEGPTTTYCFGLLCPCGNDDPDAGCGNLGNDGDFATGALLAGSGTNSLAADDLTLTMSGLKVGAAGVVFTGTVRQNAPFGNGRRCIMGPIKRYSLRAADAGGEIVVGPGEIIAAGPPTLPGDTRHYQGWYRDNGGPCGGGSNLSNALTVTWLP